MDNGSGWKCNKVSILANKSKYQPPTCTGCNRTPLIFNVFMKEYLGIGKCLAVLHACCAVFNFIFFVDLITNCR